mmetsp:Transcript_25661/g.45687  ORF Transcript_25661/g.45687 Transcript_25661/m.45687 type:complete len:478 (-) Transcript_25661:347-1780(-)
MHVRHARGNVTPRRVPVHISRHKVFASRHRLHLVHVEKLQLPVQRLEPRQHNVLALRRPKQRVAGLAVQRLQRLHHMLGAVLHRVKRHVGARAVAVHNHEAVALGLPSKGDNLLALVGQLHHLHRDVALLEAEELKGGVGALLGLCEPVHLHREVVALRVPEHLDVGHREQVLLPQLRPLWDLDERDARGQVAARLLRLKGGDDGRGGAPGKVLQTLQSQALLVQQPHLRRLVNAQAVLAHACKVLVIAAAVPFKHRPLQLPAWTHRKLVRRAREGAQFAAGADILDVEGDGDGVPLVCGLLRGVGDEVLFGGREIDEAHTRMAKLVEALKSWTAPHSHTLPMHRGQHVAARAPLHEGLSPESALVDVLWRSTPRVIPAHLRLILITDGELIAPLLVHHPLLQVLRWLILLRLRLNVSIRYLIIFIKIVKHVDAEGVALVQLVAVGVLSRGGRFLWAAELDKSKAARHTRRGVHRHM